jgi:hypothetical protein
MFTIRKIWRIQHYFYNDKLWSWQVLPDFLHEDTSLPISWVDLAVHQLQWKLKGTLHDIYSIPKFDEIADIYTFIENLEGTNWLERSEFKKWVVRDLILAYKLALDYLIHEWYHVPKLWNHLKNAQDLMRIIHKGEKYTSPKEKIAYCTLLKEVLGFFRVIRYGKFKVNYDSGFIDLRDKTFIKWVIEIFNSEPFIYDNNSIRFSEKSNEMRWSVILDWKKIDIYAGFWVKSLYALIEKMDWQEKYNLPEAFKDIHRMRIEVKDADSVLRAWKLLYTKFWWWFLIENIGSMVPFETYKSYKDAYLIDEISEWYSVALAKGIGIKWEKKTYSEDRQELKLSRNWNNEWQTPLEIQIVLVNNNNETWYAHHDIYKIRRKVAAKIRRHGWIWANWIKTIIKKVFEFNEKANGNKCTIPFSEKQIFEHITELKGFLVPIKWASEWIDEAKSWYRITTIHYTTKEVLKKYQSNYPNITKKNPIYIKLTDLNTWWESLTWISEISFPSNS